MISLSDVKVEIKSDRIILGPGMLEIDGAQTAKCASGVIFITVMEKPVYTADSPYPVDLATVSPALVFIEFDVEDGAALRFFNLAARPISLVWRPLEIAGVESAIEQVSAGHCYLRGSTLNTHSGVAEWVFEALESQTDGDGGNGGIVCVKMRV